MGNQTAVLKAIFIPPDSFQTLRRGGGHLDRAVSYESTLERFGVQVEPPNRLSSFIGHERTGNRDQLLFRRAKV